METKDALAAVSVLQALIREYQPVLGEAFLPPSGLQPGMARIRGTSQTKTSSPKEASGPSKFSNNAQELSDQETQQLQKQLHSLLLKITDKI